MAPSYQNEATNESTTWKQTNKTKLENFICNISKNLTLRIEPNWCSYNKYFATVLAFVSSIIKD